MTTCVTEGDGAFPAEAWLPQQRQVYTLKSSVSQSLSSEALVIFYTVHNDGSAQNVCQHKHVRLL